LFVGSSTEGLDVARTIHEQLDRDAEITVWSDSFFELGKATLEGRLDRTGDFDFAALVLTPDDIAIIRDRKTLVPRDNVVFELGLFMGRLGRERTFAVCEHDLPLWNDLAGITVAHYNPHRSDGNLAAALGPACNQLRRAMQRQGANDAKRSVPAFWRAFLSEESIIVLGHFSMQHFEGSGLVGFGDAMALIEVQTYADALGMSHPPVRDARQLAPGDLNKHLILLGGPDMNRHTADVLTRIKAPFHISVDGIEDILSGATHTPKQGSRGLLRDIGVIIEAANPFNSERRVLLLFGCDGYGTWAAARFAKSGSFLDAPTWTNPRDLECIVQTEINEDYPYVITPVLLRHRVGTQHRG
jgi:hypothetical protein